MRTIILSFFFFIILSFYSSAQNRLPLHLGNKWQYLVHDFSYSWEYYSLEYDSVLVDTIINNQYYAKTLRLPYYLRYSSQDKKIFINWEGSDYVFVNFTIPNYQEYQSFWDGQYHSVSSDVRNDNLFGKNRSSVGFLFMGSNWGYDKFFTDSIGMSFYSFADNHLSSNRKIIQAIIIDSVGNEIHFTNHYKPVFHIQPITQINTSEFNLDFQITHTYTVTGIDFIDSVVMLSYYKKDDSFINNQPIIPIHEIQPVNINYSISIQLDTLLLKEGYEFYYWFYAKDRGIIPEYSISPDSGSFKCIWDETLKINEINNLPYMFKLSPNYPNPFNPSTSIQYAISSRQFVTLKVYDVIGNEVAILVSEEKPAGNYEVSFDASKLSSGVYYYQLRSGEFIRTKKMIYLK